MPQTFEPYVHQYIERKSSNIIDEELINDKTINKIYSTVRESAPFLFNLLLSPRASSLLGFLNYDCPVKSRIDPYKELRALKVNPKEIFDDVKSLNTYRKLFERKIRYWSFRPIETDDNVVVSPADSKVLPGSLSENKSIFIKEKLFTFEELIGQKKWIEAFQNGDFVVCRLTPDKYHYNHAPVSGEVKEIYEIDGKFHSCNPGAIVKSVTPYSKNRRVVTIIDTDVDGGTNVGLVAMVEIVALMIGQIVQCYSRVRYDNPTDLIAGDFIEKGQPKSLFRPGSSTTVVLFQKEKINFSEDLLNNVKREDVNSRLSIGFKKPLVETDLNVRETIGRRG